MRRSLSPRSTQRLHPPPRPASAWTRLRPLSSGSSTLLPRRTSRASRSRARLRRANQGEKIERPGRPMLIVLPLLTYSSLLLTIGNMQRGADWGRAGLRAAILWGTYAAISAELLGLIHGITPLGLTLAWGRSSPSRESWG